MNYKMMPHGVPTVGSTLQIWCCYDPADEWGYDTIRLIKFPEKFVSKVACHIDRCPCWSDPLFFCQIAEFSVTFVNHTYLGKYYCHDPDDGDDKWVEKKHKNVTVTVDTLLCKTFFWVF